MSAWAKTLTLLLAKTLALLLAKTLTLLSESYSNNSAITQICFIKVYPKKRYSR